jgi:hypothetical protein
MNHGATLRRHPIPEKWFGVNGCMSPALIYGFYCRRKNARGVGIDFNELRVVKLKKPKIDSQRETLFPNLFAMLWAMLLLSSGCSLPNSINGDSRDVLDTYQFAVGYKTIPIVVSRKYFVDTIFPRPRGGTVEGLIFVFDYRSGEPADFSEMENGNAVAVRYETYYKKTINKRVDPEYLNYYSGYRVVDEYLGLERRGLAFNQYLVQQGQDQSFILLQKSTNGTYYDLMIECIQATPTSYQGPCRMQVELSNGVIASLTIDRSQLQKWSEIIAGVRRFSTSIGIDKEP